MLLVVVLVLSTNWHDLTSVPSNLSWRLIDELVAWLEDIHFPGITISLNRSFPKLVNSFVFTPVVSSTET